MSYIDDGFSTTIGFANYPSVQFKEKQVQSPGFDGGGGNDTTTMRNTAVRTMAPKKLWSLTDCTLIVSYDPIVMNTIKNMINEVQEITVNQPDGSEWVFWGWLNRFTPQRNQEGTQPEAEAQIIPGNQDDNGAEVVPTYNAP